MQRALGVGPKKRKSNRIIDLDMQRSIGAISSMEYKRRTIINEINNVAYSLHKTSLPAIYINPIRTGAPNFVQDDILGMEVDPRESKCLLVISRYNSVAIYNVSQNVKIFDQMKRMTIPHDPIDNNGSPNSAHWLWDGTVFTVCTMDSVHFWDSFTCKIIETVKMRTKVLNHVMAAKKYSANKLVAVTGIEGHVFLIDMFHGIVVMTMKNIENKPIRTISWHPLNELQYVTGNDNGNIYLWDIRYQLNYVLKFQRDDSGAPVSSLTNPVIGLRFYNYGNDIISVDSIGGINTWEVSTGLLRPNHYEPVLLCDLNKNHIFKDYQFAVTEHLKEDIVFFPSKKGMRIFDIESGEHLPFSNDISIPMNCATYDTKRFCVYGGSNDVIKVWTPEKKLAELNV
ncbi:DNA excision repair protein ERCC-8-like [Melanaphis sacchari]|uniref:DNA excision repair protein ERCC-8-like n=1 Tax=Melanaphis sacchari TaxID=742174 RepID=UPI000DC14B02|nr:DNA excision repair protein ERCC-8-like [Melanaphis sacchari]XP_025198047.1 DNA excision repair protein ERCC-8-like [Melanaphis sacchari]